MNDFFSPEIIGLVYQTYAIAFFILSAVIYTLPKHSRVFIFAQHLWLLGIFGVLHGIVEMLEFQRIYTENETISFISRALLPISFFPLLEFGCCTFRTVSKRSSLLLIVSIYSSVIVGTTACSIMAHDPIIGFATGGRIFVGFSGAILASISLFSGLKAHSSYLLSRFFYFWTITVSLSFLVYGLSTLFVTQSDSYLPRWIPNQTDFLFLFGVPVQLIRSICAVLITSGFSYLVYKINEDVTIDASIFHGQGAVVITDHNKVILKANDSFIRSTGYGIGELIGKKISILKSDRHDDVFYKNMWEQIHKTGSWNGEIWDKRKNDEIYPKWLTITAIKNTSGNIAYYVGTHTDLTEHKAKEEEIQRLAFYDFLTGLPNRRLLLDRLNLALISCCSRKKMGAIVFIDMDNFKNLNDVYGHEMGDLLLKQVAERLKLCVRERDTVSRFGGDEFVMLLENLSPLKLEAKHDIEQICKKIMTSLNEDYQLDRLIYHSTPSIGVTLFDGNKTDTNELLKQADDAMYKSKQSGRNTVNFYNLD